MLASFNYKMAEVSESKLNDLKGGIKSNTSSFTYLADKYLKKIITSKNYDFSMLSLCKQDVIEKLNSYLN